MNAGVPGVLAMRYDWRGNAKLAVPKMSAEAREATIRLTDLPGQTLSILLCEDHSRGDRRGTYKLELPPYGYGWYRVGSMPALQPREPRSRAVTDARGGRRQRPGR